MLILIYPEFEEYFRQRFKSDEDATPIKSISLGYTSENLKKFLISLEKHSKLDMEINKIFTDVFTGYYIYYRKEILQKSL